MSITSKTPVEAHGAKIQPAHPWNFAKEIEYSQERELRYNADGIYHVLFNKGRYFEVSIYDHYLIKQIKELCDVEVVDTSVCGSWRQLEDFVIAMNLLNYYVDIKIDWV